MPARRDASGNVYYYFQDQIGTSRLIATSGGIGCYHADYAPFGQELAYVNNCPQNYRFTGMERDTETGNDHTWFRGYEWSLGRWLSPDPLAGDVANPQSLNRYTYVLNDPCSLADPLGLKPSCSYTVRLTSQVKDPGFIGTMETEIQRIFGLAGLSVDFTSASSADFSLGVVNGVSPNGPRIAGETPSEYYGAPPGHYGYVYAGTMTSLVPLTGVSYGFLGTALGRAGAQEMGHYFLGQLDHLVAQGLMQAGFAGNTWFLPDPNGILFGFTPDQAAQLRNDCAQRHPSSSGGGGGGGGGRAGGPPYVYAPAYPDTGGSGGRTREPSGSSTSTILGWWPL